MRHLPYFVAPLVCTLACTETERAITPGGGQSSGYFAVDVAEPDLDASSVTEVRVADNRAYHLTALDDEVLRFTVQGASTPGAADVTLAAPVGDIVLPGAFVYEPPLDPRFSRFVAVGASLTQGVQNGVPTQHGALVSPPAQMARQLGAYFPLPLLIAPFLSEISAEDIGPPPACSPPDVIAHVAVSALDVIPTLSAGYHNARIDPDIAVHNLAVGGSKIATVVHGPAADDFAGNFVARFVYAPYESGPVPTSQLEEAEALDPTLVVITDLYDNDIAAAVLSGEVIDPELITPIEEFRADLLLLLDRLDATNAEVFIGNMPQPSLLPLTVEKRVRMVAQGSTAAEADAAIAEMDGLAVDFNRILDEETAARARIHVVDVAGRVHELAKSGLSAGGQVLTTRKFGGLLGFDGVHFTDTGYAMLANLFLENINTQLGTQAPQIDLDSVVAHDAGSPSAIAAAGLDVSRCE